MPVYEYACEKCGKTTEALRRMAEADEPIACEACGSDKTHRAHSVTAVGSSDKGDTPLPISGGGGCCPCGNSQSACGAM